MFKEGVQLFQGARHSFLGGGFAGSERAAHCAKIQPLIEAQHHRRAIRRAQPVDRIVEQWRNLCKVRFRGI